MQNLILLLLFPLFSFSQLDYNKYVTSNHIEKMTWNSEKIIIRLMIKCIEDM